MAGGVASAAPCGKRAGSDCGGGAGAMAAAMLDAGNRMPGAGSSPARSVLAKVGKVLGRVDANNAAAPGSGVPAQS